METNTLLVSQEKQIGLILSVGAVALTMLPYNKELCAKIGMSKEQFTYLKLHFKNNPKRALDELLTACKERRKEI